METARDEVVRREQAEVAEQIAAAQLGLGPMPEAVSPDPLPPGEGNMWMRSGAGAVNKVRIGSEMERVHREGGAILSDSRGRPAEEPERTELVQRLTMRAAQ